MTDKQLLRKMKKWFRESYEWGIEPDTRKKIVFVRKSAVDNIFMLADIEVARDHGCEI